MATQAQIMVDALETAIKSNAGIVQVNIDGTSVRYDRKQALDELLYWQRRQARESRTRPAAAQVYLGGH